jgi:hypothetical protein
MCVKSKPKKPIINRALLQHNYSFRNSDKYKPLRSKEGAIRRTMNSKGEGLSPPQGE